MLCACRKTDDSIPRRYAYPRIETYDTIYRNVAVGPVNLYVNKAAGISTPRPGWLDINYPRYGATFHVSVTTTNSVADAIANRRERIALNLGGSRAKTNSFRSGDFECIVVESPEAGMTPVQFLAVSPKGIIVSGTAYITGSTTSVDSIHPIVTALTTDAIKMLSDLDDN